ncbi:MAG: hypothetical protein HGB02_09160 [Chlorobiaceae bacterium]|nr:hypothetical protein [Chlorobiaceae bacterium]
MQTQLRPLGIVKEVVEEIGLQVTYAYDDLVFVEHNDFLLQFGNDPSLLHLHFNTECPEDEAVALTAKLIPAAACKGLSMQRKGTYTMDEDENDNLRISFNP